MQDEIQDHVVGDPFDRRQVIRENHGVLGAGGRLAKVIAESGSSGCTPGS